MSWSNYGLPDPLIPFNETRLLELKELLREGASDSIGVISRLKGISDGSGGIFWAGPAAFAFFTELSGLPDDLVKLFDSYSSGYSAVNTYVNDLTDLRTKADRHLTSADAYGQRIRNNIWERDSLPDTEQERKDELQRHIDDDEYGQDQILRSADDLRTELRDAAAKFKRSMAYAQDIGIHNRNFFVRIYEDHIEIYVEAFLGAWEDLGPWIDALSVVLFLVPGGQPLAIVIKGMQIARAVVVGVQAVDILLSDDDADFGFFFDAGMSAIGFGAGHVKKQAGEQIINQMRGGISLSQTDYRGAFKIASTVGRTVDVVDLWKDTASVATATIPTLQNPTVNRIDEPHSDAVGSSWTSADIGFDDVIWGMGRDSLTRFITSPTLVDINVEIKTRQP